MSYQDAYVGRAVHYFSRGSADGEFKPKCRAAIVTETHAGSLVSLCVLNPQGMFYDQHVEWSPAMMMDGPAPGSWHEIEECRGDYLDVD